MASDWLAALLSSHLAGCWGVLAVLVLRRPVRKFFGSQAAYRLWLVPVLTAAAVWLPRWPVPKSTSGLVEAEASTGFPIIIEFPAPDVPADMAGAILLAWLIGALVAAGVLIARQHRFHRRCGVLHPFGSGQGENSTLWRATRSGIGPAVIGLLNPKIILPADFDQTFSAQEQAFMVAHEQVHLRSGHALGNGAMAVWQVLNWFNPLTYAVAFLVRLDQELACDAAVLERFPHSRQPYAELLLKAQLRSEVAPVGCAWPPSSNDVLKERIMNLKRNPTDKTRRAIGSVITIGLSALCCSAAWAVQPIEQSVQQNLSTIVAVGGETEGTPYWRQARHRGSFAVHDGLHLTVGTGISVVAPGIGMRCTDGASCRFELEPGETAVLAAESDKGRAPVWVGCPRLDAANRCLVWDTGSPVFVRVL